MNGSGQPPAGALALADLKELIRTIPDFPAKGIQFRDITTLIADGPGFSSSVSYLAQRALPHGFDAVAGVEARGFIFGAAIAEKLGVGFLPVRKAGKLPVATIGVDYQLEYGAARIEIDPSAIKPGERVLLVDDLIATGGTALAAIELLRQAGAEVDQAMFVIDLPDLGGAARLHEAGVTVDCLFDFPGD